MWFRIATSNEWTVIKRRLFTWEDHHSGAGGASRSLSYLSTLFVWHQVQPISTWATNQPGVVNNRWLTIASADCTSRIGLQSKRQKFTKTGTQMCDPVRSTTMCNDLLSYQERARYLECLDLIISLIIVSFIIRAASISISTKHRATPPPPDAGLLTYEAARLYWSLGWEEIQEGSMNHYSWSQHWLGTSVGSSSPMWHHSYLNEGCERTNHHSCLESPRRGRGCAASGSRRSPGCETQDEMLVLITVSGDFSISQVSNLVHGVIMFDRQGNTESILELPLVSYSPFSANTTNPRLLCSISMWRSLKDIIA